MENRLAKSSSDYVPVLDYLRGFAASAVCFFHFTNGNLLFLPATDPFRSAGHWGRLGVECFFVISGFVIPYSLFKKQLHLSGLVDFFARRLKRLEPPYLACIVLAVLLNGASHWAGNSAVSASPYPSAQQLLAHIGYANALLGYEWLNPVFWTLALEFQFYLFVAAAFWLIANDNAAIRSCATPLFAGIGVLADGSSSLLPQWLPLFSLGIGVSQYFRGCISRPWLAACLSVCGVAALKTLGMVPAIAGLLTALTILGVGCRKLPTFLWPLQALGVISYSLYLVHVPIGMRVVNLACRLPDDVALRYLAVVAAFCVSVIAAILYYRYVEAPSARWSRAQPRPQQRG